MNVRRKEGWKNGKIEEWKDGRKGKKRTSEENGSTEGIKEGSKKTGRKRKSKRQIDGRARTRAAAGRGLAWPESECRGPGLHRDSFVPGGVSLARTNGAIHY